MDADQKGNSNMPKKELVQGFLDKMMHNHTETETQRAKNRNSIKPFYQDRDQILESAFLQGIGKKSLTAAHKTAVAIKNLLQKEAKLDEHTGPEYAHIVDQNDLFGAVPLSDDALKAQKADADEIKSLKLRVKTLKAELAEFTGDTAEKPIKKAVDNTQAQA